MKDTFANGLKTHIKRPSARGFLKAIGTHLSAAGYYPDPDYAVLYFKITTYAELQNASLDLTRNWLLFNMKDLNWAGNLTSTKVTADCYIYEQFDGGSLKLHLSRLSINVFPLLLIETTWLIHSVSTFCHSDSGQTRLIGSAVRFETKTITKHNF